MLTSREGKMKKDTYMYINTGCTDVYTHMYLTINLLPLTSIRSNVFSDMHTLHDYVIINSLNYMMNGGEGVSSGKRERSGHDQTAAVFGNS